MFGLIFFLSVMVMVLFSLGVGGRSTGLCTLSMWQRGVSLLGFKKDDPPNWFKKLGLTKKVVSNLLTSF